MCEVYINSCPQELIYAVDGDREKCIMCQGANAVNKNEAG